jgi:hypothetical protein
MPNVQSAINIQLCMYVARPFDLKLVYLSNIFLGKELWAGPESSTSCVLVS